jgi:hypothetical protein
MKNKVLNHAYMKAFNYIQRIYYVGVGRFEHIYKLILSSTFIK